MRIKRFLHSCILIENKGKRVLFDPGAFSFIEKTVSPKDIGKVDAIVLTHKHLDHYHPDALRAFNEMSPTPIYANHEVADLLKKENIACNLLEANHQYSIGGMNIETFNAPHGAIPAEIPHNLAFLVDKTFLHPGDSYHVEGLTHAPIVGMPIAGPWAKLTEALDFARALKPTLAVPIHDAIVKDYMLERMYTMCKTKLENEKIAFNSLKLDEQVDI